MKKFLGLCLVVIWIFSTGFTWTITMDNTLAIEVRDALCARHGYQSMVGDPPVPNPVSKSDFAKGVIKNYIREEYKAWKQGINYETAKGIIDSISTTSQTATAGITVQ